jgi:hypothetical protein
MSAWANADEMSVAASLAYPPLEGGAIAYGKTGHGEKPAYPPLEGEGRSHWTKRSFVRCDRGGVIVHPQPIHPALLASHPTPARVALRATRADPPPPGEGKQEMRRSPVLTCNRPAASAEATPCLSR